MNIKKKSKNGVTFLTFPILEESGVRHGFSTRLGGVSLGELASMNLSFSRGDDPEKVMENHRRFAAAVGYIFCREGGISGWLGSTEKLSPCA